MTLITRSRLAAACLSVVAVIAAVLVPAVVADVPAQANASTASAPSSTLPAGERSVIITVPSTQLGQLISFVSNLRLTTKYQYRHALSGISVVASKGQISLITSEFPDAKVEDNVEYTIGDTQTSAPWNLSLLDQSTFSADSTYTYPATAGAGVKAYVVDTGIAPNATQFGTRLVAGHDFTGSGSTVDCNGHGTHVAGTIGSRDYGVAKGVTLVPLRALAGTVNGQCSDGGTSDDVIAAIDWAINDNPAGKRAVLNMSLGSVSPSGTDSTMNAAVTRALNDGIVVVVAAGNSASTKQSDGRIWGEACDYSPANSPGTITVGAVDSSGREASFSNYGQCVDIMAPGVLIRSLKASDPSGYEVLNGTSMATPHVTGAFALYIAEHPTQSVDTIKTNVLAAARADAVILHTGGSPVYDTSSPNPQRVFGMTTPTHVGTSTTRLMLNVANFTPAESAPTFQSAGTAMTVTRLGANLAPQFRIDPASSSQLTASPGTWQGYPSPTFSYEWFRCDTQVLVAQDSTPAGCVTTNVSTGIYSVTEADIGSYMAPVVTATNSVGSAMKFMPTTKVVGQAPVATIRPSLTPNYPKVGRALGLAA
ncbi:MAG: hypothetical protein RLZZ600_77, partial [Actinomycetota bacterium]